MTSKLALENSSAISQKLIAAARNKKPEALFELGVITLRQKKAGFAKIFFEAAAKQGHSVAQRYIHLYHDVNHSVSAWRNLVLMKEDAATRITTDRTYSHDH